MKKQRKKGIIKTICAVSLLLLNSTSLFSQTFSIRAGSNQVVNWERTHSAELKASVPSDKMKVEWACPQNSHVVFKNASSPVTEVTFPRPGYYLLVLSGKTAGQDPMLSSTIVNVFARRSHDAVFGRARNHCERAYLDVVAARAASRGR